ncbi:RNA polymerase III Rpc4 [Macleaya cordata]|uniref:RNA polymerase III Rpc4 n=1 Tax=Macleaya cordata TaxID=56857 RepID=A0A200QSF8_MACCD|nr:RNA polymerase III Rpc4 [Macleaya cordata]
MKSYGTPKRAASILPELLDDEEFGEASADMAYEEDTLNPALELGLMEESEDARMVFLQLPASLPLMKRSATAESNETAGSSRPSKPVDHLEKGCSLEELPPGFMGKLLVHKSGAVKLKLGDTLYDVSPGSDCTFANDVVAINTEGKQCCSVGELNKRAVVTPDVDSLLTSMANLD